MEKFTLQNMQSNCEYVADTNVHVYLKDCMHLDSALYACCGESHRRDNQMDVALFVKDKKNITIDFQGHTFYLHGRIQPFIFDHCENIRIKNVIVEYDRSFCTEFEVLESTSTRLRGRLSEKFPCKVEDGKIVPYGEYWENHDLNRAPVFLQTFDKNTRVGNGLSLVVFGNHLDMDEEIPWVSTTPRLIARFDGEDIVFEGEDIPVLKVGNIAVIGHEDRRYSNLYAVNCKNLYIENYRIINGAGMGILPFHTENIYIDGLKMTYDERSHGVHTNEADGIHAVSCSGDFVLKNSIIEGTIDDALNIHGNFFVFQRAEGNKLYAVCKGSVCKDYTLFGVGDTIRIYHGSTLELGGEYTIESIRRINVTEWEFTLDKPLGEHVEGDVIENFSAQPKILMENCVFGKANTHLRFQSRGGITVKNCETELPFLLTGDMNYWYESSPVENMTVENVEFVGKRGNILCAPDFMPTEKQPYYHGRLNVVNCSFDTDTPVTAHHIRLIEFQNNVNIRGEQMKFDLAECGEVYAEGVNVERR